jgi:hypothetical protein
LAAFAGGGLILGAGAGDADFVEGVCGAGDAAREGGFGTGAGGGIGGVVVE